MSHFRKIGCGGYSSVYSNGIHVLKYAEDDDASRKQLMNELLIILQLSHPNIIKILSYHCHNNTIWIRMPLIIGSTLRAAIHRGPFTLDRHIHVMKQFADTLSHIHKQDIIHRDLKLDNILIDDTDHITVIDFGMAHKGSIVKGKCGTFEYLAPEVSNRHEYDGKGADIWAAGNIWYALITGQLPNFIIDGDIRDIKNIQIRRIIMRMVQIDPIMRPTADELNGLIGQIKLK